LVQAAEDQTPLLKWLNIHVHTFLRPIVPSSRTMALIWFFNAFCLWQIVLGQTDDALCAHGSVLLQVAFQGNASTFESPLQMQMSAPESAGYAGSTYLFVAGLEGTSHHFWHTILQECKKQGACVVRDEAFHKAMWKKRKSITDLTTAWAKNRPQTSKLLITNTLRGKGMMSYPNFKGKRQGYPALDKYAQVARSYGDRLKVLLLMRSPQDLLASDMKRFKRTEKDLVRSTRRLAAQLRQIPRNTIRCLQYEDLAKGAEWLSQFLKVKGFNIGGAVKEHFLESAGCQGSPQGCPNAPLLTEAMKELDEFCTTQTRLLDDNSPGESISLWMTGVEE
jgi:hypothetical protein